jgi:hypothetical protein
LAADPFCEALAEPAPTLAGPTLAGPTLAGPSLAGPTLAGPTLAETTLAGPTLAETRLAETRLAGPTLAGPTLAETRLAGTELAGPGVDEPGGPNAAGAGTPEMNCAGPACTAPAGELVGADGVGPNEGLTIPSIVRAACRVEAAAPVAGGVGLASGSWRRFRAVGSSLSSMPAGAGGAMASPSIVCCGSRDVGLAISGGTA